MRRAQEPPVAKMAMRGPAESSGRVTHRNFQNNNSVVSFTVTRSEGTKYGTYHGGDPGYGFPYNTLVLGSPDTVSTQKSLAKSFPYASRHTRNSSFNLNLSTSRTGCISALAWIMLFLFLLKLISCSVHKETVRFVLGIKTQVNLNKIPFLLIPTRDNVPN